MSYCTERNSVSWGLSHSCTGWPSISRPWLHLRLGAPGKFPSPGQSLLGLICTSAPCHGDWRCPAESTGPPTHRLRSQLGTVRLLAPLSLLQACSPTILFLSLCLPCPGPSVLGVLTVDDLSCLCSPEGCCWLREAISASRLCPPLTPN